MSPIMAMAEMTKTMQEQKPIMVCMGSELLYPSLPSSRAGGQKSHTLMSCFSIWQDVAKLKLGLALRLTMFDRFSTSVVRDFRAVNDVFSLRSVTMAKVSLEKQ